MNTNNPIALWLSMLPPHLRTAVPALTVLLDERGNLSYTTASTLLSPEAWGEVLEAAQVCIVSAYQQRGADPQEIVRRINEGREQARNSLPDITPISTGEEN